MHSLLLKKGKHVFFTINIFLNLKDAKGRSTFCIKFKEGFFVFFSSCSFVNLFKSKHSDAEVSNGGLSFIILLDRASLSLRRSIETPFFFRYYYYQKKKSSWFYTITWNQIRFFGRFSVRYFILGNSIPSVKVRHGLSDLTMRRCTRIEFVFNQSRNLPVLSLHHAQGISTQCRFSGLGCI